MLTLTGYTDNQIQVLVDFMCLETHFYKTEPKSVESAKNSDYSCLISGVEASNLKVKEGVINDFLYRLVKEYTGTPEDFEVFLKGHLDSVYKAVCAVSAKEKIRKLIEEAKALTNAYDLVEFYESTR